MPLPLSGLSGVDLAIGLPGDPAYDAGNPDFAIAQAILHKLGLVPENPFSLIQGDKLPSNLESIDGFLNFARTTGVLYWDGFNDLGSAQATIGAGSGQIVDNSTPGSSITYPVTWEADDIDLSGLADGVQNWIYIDTAGEIQVTDTDPSHEGYRLALPLQRVVVRSGEISGSICVANPTQQLSGEIYDIWRVMGVRKHRGDFVLSANGAGGAVNISQGDFYVRGVSFVSDPTNPNEDDIASQTPATFRMVNRNNVQTSDLTALDVTNYDVAGTPTAMTANHWGIYTCFAFPQGGGEVNNRFLRPQTQYSKLSDAQEALYSGLYSPVIPTNLEDAFCLGWIIFQKGDTNLASAGFITSNTSGGIGGAVFSIGTGFAQIGGDNNFTGQNTFSNASFSLTNLPTYATNAAAVSGGLAVNRVYKTATGELRIVV